MFDVAGDMEIRASDKKFDWLSAKIRHSDWLNISGDNLVLTVIRR